MRASPTILQRLPIRRGAHASRDDGLCAMEMVAWLAGEEHSDGPRCACPVLGALVRAFNDVLPDDGARERYLRPLIPRLVNSRGSHADERRRGYRLVDAAVRSLAPQILEAGGRPAAAAMLRALPAIVDRPTAQLARGVLEPHGDRVRAALWIAERAASSAAPESWAAALARLAATPRRWQQLATLLAELLETPVARPERCISTPVTWTAAARFASRL